MMTVSELVGVLDRVGVAEAHFSLKGETLEVTLRAAHPNGMAGSFLCRTIKVPAVDGSAVYVTGDIVAAAVELRDQVNGLRRSAA
jgi:hypothetical protein